MAVLRMHVEKYWAALNEYWTNVYYTNTGTLSDAVTLAAGIATLERALYPSSVTITKVRADDMVPNTDNFATQVLNLAGTRTAMATGSWLPLFNTVRVDFSSADAGRPSRKYIRGTLNEDDLAGPVSLETGTLTRVATYASALVGLAVCDVDGADLTNYATWPAPNIHDLHRRSKKKTTP